MTNKLKKIKFLNRRETEGKGDFQVERKTIGRNIFIVAIIFSFSLMFFLFSAASGEETKDQGDEVSAVAGEGEEVDEGGVFSTWKGFLEADRCATAWLIKRFIDESASFKFYPHGTTEMAGEPFDVPLSESLRRPNHSIFESFLLKHELKDPVLRKMGTIMRDIEINTWGPKATKEAAGLEAIVRGLNRVYEQEEVCLEKSFIIFDALYAELEAR